MRRAQARFIVALGGALAASALGCIGSGVAAEPDRPNILLILVDDLGIETLATYGGTSYETPHVDRLARDGLVFERAFATPVCTPTRVQLLTGMYPFRTGWTMGEWDRKPDDRIVDPELPSVARALREGGYRTAVAGKWQLSRPYEAPDHPVRFGFDRHLLWTYHSSEASGLTSRFWAPSLVEDGVLRDDLDDDDVFGPDLFCGFLERFIEEQEQVDAPFFALYSMALVHRPYIVTPAADPTPGSTPAKTEDDLTRFGSNVEYMDRLVGRLLRALERTGQLDDTLILFTADNGTDFRIRSTVGSRSVEGGKTRMTDLGAMVPMIAHWPGVTPAGARCSDLVDFTDVLPTLTQVGDARRPDASVDGRSFASQLRGERGTPRDWVFVQLRRKWFVRSATHQLHEDGRLVNVEDPFEPVEVTDELGARRTREQLAATAAALLDSR